MVYCYDKIAFGGELQVFVLSRTKSSPEQSLEAQLPSWFVLTCLGGSVVCVKRLGCRVAWSQPQEVRVYANSKHGGLVTA